MKLLLGLGNPGRDYENTRHNLGHLVIDKLLSRLGLTLSGQPKLSADLAKVGQGSDAIFLGKNTTYMNLSGDAVQKIAAYYKINPSEIYIIHDDLDLGVGEYRHHFDRGPAGHNGIKSIIECLGTQAFNRVRVGVGHPRNSATPKLPVEDYVLLPFSSEEKVIIGETVDKIVKELESQFKL